MTQLKTQINQALKYIRTRTKFNPEVGIILGTGLGDLADEIKKETIIPYAKIPGFARSTVATHKGELMFGILSGKKVVAMEGRFHHYEGYTLQQTTFPVRVMKALGIKILVVSSAVGSVNPDLPCGTVVLLQDHINLMSDNPLIGPNDDSLGERFPDMSETYDHELLDMAEEVAKTNKIKVGRGIYAALTGPNLETPAEYRMLRIIGADVVGMSTVPEVIVGVHCGLRIMALSVVTDLATPESIKKVNLKEIIAIANAAQPKMATIVKGVLAKI
ncbi:purine-nucleoside phosphorylase [Candidatus Woesearchaeota archaeon]|nr:purine-nucleoside phosphorylase [Candidatus Woesearchaeota archaeon]